MKFSDALMLGSTIVKPLRGVMMNTKGEGCALGMAYKAVGANFVSFGTDDGLLGSLDCPFYWLSDELTTPLPCGCSGEVMSGGGWFHDAANMRDAQSQIIHLFNQHVCDGSWSIEKLADWVRSVEPAEQEEVTESVKEAVHATA